MIYICFQQGITQKVSMSIMKGTSGVPEDLSKADIYAWLISEDDKINVTDSCLQLVDGKLVIDLNGVNNNIEPLPANVYSVKALWYKNGNQEKYSVCEVHNCFAITTDPEEATPYTGTTVTIKVKAPAATYGYDGLSAYELACMRGTTTALTEKEWVQIRASEIEENQIADGAITTPKIANGAVTTQKIEDYVEGDTPTGVTTDKLANGAVTTPKIADGAVITGKLADDAVTTRTIADSAVTTAKILSGNVTRDKISVGAVTTEKIDDAAVTTAKIDGEAVTTDKLADGAITTSKIEDYDDSSATPTGVTTDKLHDGAVTEAKIADSAVITGKIAGGAVTTAKIQDRAVTTAKLEDYDGSNTDPTGVTNAKIADGAVTTLKLHDSAVDTAQIANGAVVEGKLANGAVTEGKLATGAVTTGKLSNGAVETDKIAASAVTGDKIAGMAVTESKIGDGAVTTGKIDGGAVTETKIGTGAVTEDKIGTGAVTTTKIANGSVTTDKLEDYTTGSTGVITEKIADGAVTTEKIANGAVTRDKLDDDSVSDLTALYDTFQAQIEALADEVKVTLSAAPNVVYKGVQTTITLTATMQNYDASAGVDIEILDGSTVIASDDDSPVSGTTSLTASTNTKTYTAEGVYKELTKKASATVNARYPIYFGFGDNAAGVASDAEAQSPTNAQKYDPTTTAVHTYQRTNALNGKSFFILVPSDITGLSNFVMNGAPFVMLAQTTETIGTVNYKVYQSANVYNSGTTIKVTAS